MKRARIGGQAVIEGVMMKYEDQYAVAVRKPDQEIEVKVESYTPIGEKYKILNRFHNYFLYLTTWNHLYFHSFQPVLPLHKNRLNMSAF